MSTGGKTGAPVLAPGAGVIERVRTSGVGYGRSLYLRVNGDRLIVFGHLDAFAPEIAAYVDSVQRSTGEYEQDLWPATGRFRVAAGERIAWSGETLPEKAACSWTGSVSAPPSTAAASRRTSPTSATRRKSR